ncbi:MAG: phage major tail tube protein [Bacteroidota bacterium]
MNFPYILKHYNLFIGKRGDGLGASYAGKVTNVALPVLEIATSEYQGVGMDMPLDVDMGMRKMTSSMTLREYNPDAIKLFGLGTRAPASVALKGVVDNESGDGPQKVEIQMDGMWTKIDMGSWATGKSQEMRLYLTVEYYKLTIGEEELVEIDVVNMVRKINGVDALEGARSILGL